MIKPYGTEGILPPVGPDGAKWGLPLYQYQEDLEPDGDADEDEEDAPNADEQQLHTEIQDVERDKDEVLDAMEHERTKEEVQEKLLDWIKTHEAVAKELEVSDKDAAEDRRRVAAEIADICRQFMLTSVTDEDEVGELADRVADLNPDTYEFTRQPESGDVLKQEQSDDELLPCDGSLMAPDETPEPLMAQNSDDAQELPAVQEHSLPLPVETCSENVPDCTRENLDNLPLAQVQQSGTPEVPEAPVRPTSLLDVLKHAKEGINNALESEDNDKLLQLLEEIQGLKLTWDAVRESAVGKEVGKCSKHTDPAVADRAKALVAQFFKLAKRGKAGMSYTQ